MINFADSPANLFTLGPSVKRFAVVKRFAGESFTLGPSVKRFAGESQKIRRRIFEIYQVVARTLLSGRAAFNTSIGSVKHRFAVDFEIWKSEVRARPTGLHSESEASLKIYMNKTQMIRAQFLPLE